MKKLSELVEIRSGYSFRTAVDQYENGDTEVIQSKDLGDDFYFAFRPKIAFPGEGKHLLKPGEILLAARGYAKARVFRANSGKAVASSSLFVLTPKSLDITSEFIAMFFNSVVGIREYEKMSAGASVKLITKDDLGSIEIPMIAAQDAQALGNLIQSIDDYRALLLEKEIQIDALREGIISKTLKGATT